MLSLFTVLVISFVVFSSQAVSSSVAREQRSQDEVLAEPPIESVLTQLLVGTSDSKSAALGNGLLEDFYGEGQLMRVGHRRRSAGTPAGAAPNPILGRGQLLLPFDNTGQVQTTLFKFPTELAVWNYNGDTGDLPPDTVSSVTPITPELRAHLDDAFSNRIMAFDEGPLKNIPFRIIRSFGNLNGTSDGGATIEPDPQSISDYHLAGNFVIDLAEIGEEIITIDGVRERLYLVAANFPNRLLYSPGVDDRPGRAGVDDDGINGVDDDGELGYPGTDDYGFRFVLNGSVFSGRGINPDGSSGLARNERPDVSNITFDSIDPYASVEMTINPRLTGGVYRAGDITTGLLPELNESWDAADWENLFLAWQPSDHRRSANQTVYAGIGAEELNRRLGQHIIPSFHRPSIINYLMNSPIRIPGDALDPGAAGYVERSFQTIKESSPAVRGSNNDGLRLRFLAYRLRRATIRPLNFSHNFFDAANSDLNADGDPFDGSPFFSGSNSANILNFSIETDDPDQFIQDIEDLATWLVNGPWDVDNDGDGVPDSVWVDFNLPVTTAPDGQLIKPMVAPLIEDWDGKVNLNVAGSYNQLVTQKFRTSLPQYSNEAEYFAVNQTLGSFGRGGGIGPAEIDFSHLFSGERSFNALTHVGPRSTTQTGNALSIDQVLFTRYGNLLNVRYGAPVFNYTRPYPYSSPTTTAARFLHFPGSGTRFDPAPNSDLLSRIPFPSREDVHDANSIAGRPLDLAGMSQVRKGVDGTQIFTDLPNNDDLLNQPYEIGATELRGDDTPFSVAEMIDFQKGGALDGRLSQLLGDAADRNQALRRLVATESRSVDLPELPGVPSVLHLFAEKFEPTQGNPIPPRLMPPEAQSIQMQRMLAVELRKGSKLNLNRQLANGVESNGNVFVDESSETETTLLPGSAGLATNVANNRIAAAGEVSFPQITSAFAAQGNARPSYGSTSIGPIRNAGTVSTPSAITNHVVDFDGVDTNGDGNVNVGTRFDVDGDNVADSFQKMADGSELLARHLYCLMFKLIENETSGELVPNFPYPVGFVDNSAPNIPIRNRYVARRLAQWAANAVDYRDTDVRCTRLRYDPNPFDGDGFSLDVASRNTVWGMERPVVELTEALATHNKRLKRNLDKARDPADASLTLDGEFADDDDVSDPAIASDSDMDQFRIPQASAFVEIKALAPPTVGNGERQPSRPRELYTSGRLDLGRVVGTGRQRTPVWRLAVGEPTRGQPAKSTRFLFEADRLRRLATSGDSELTPGYLDQSFEGSIIDWADSTSVDAAIDTWNETIRYAADIRPSGRRGGGTPDPLGTEYVTLSDNNLNPADDVNGPDTSRIRLTRFAWFAKLSPGVGLDIVGNNDSGMRLDNVFFNTNSRVDPADATLPENQAAQLDPGQYAIVAPRALTHFGQKRASMAPLYPYNPSDQQIGINLQTPAANGFRLDYFGNGSADPRTPLYPEDATATTGYNVNSIVPIICESLSPEQVAAAVPGWNDYRMNVAAAQQVDMGFNISAPLAGLNYYTAPEYFITQAAGQYPQQDGYRDYDNAVGLHPDRPFDYRASAPLAGNNFEWAAVGTHEEAVTIFMQRLADPTSPWHAVDNPYVTVDFLPMDLTTFNGEHDVRQEIVRNMPTPPANPGDPPGPLMPQNDLVDSKSAWDSASGDFEPLVKFDTRRKIPNPDNDRAVSFLIPTNPTPSGFADFDRQLFAKRSPLSAAVNILRPTTGGPIGTSVDYFPYEMGSMWDNGMATPAAVALDTNYGFDGAGQWLTFDEKADGFTQSLGFVNREYGVPLNSRSQHVQTVGFQIGHPNGVAYTTVPWMDREYQSPYDLMNVPAVSRTSLLGAFSPGTRLEEPARNREVPVPFEHLLGFENGYAQFRAEDLQLQNGSSSGAMRDRVPLGFFDLEHENDAVERSAVLTGERAGFEQIFDYVDVGPVWFDSQRWFEPNNVQFRRDALFDTNPDPIFVARNRMFNRSVETLQPPYNYIGHHRTPGKINLNTMPDYVRKGPEFDGMIAAALGRETALSANQFLKGQGTFLDHLSVPSGNTYLEAPSDPSTTSDPLFGPAPVLMSSEPDNFPINPNGFTQNFFAPDRVAPVQDGAVLFGNGSVYRSLSWAISTPYELDTVVGSPSTLGQENRYERDTDTSFGRSFKAFIESRRGYSTAEQGFIIPAPPTVNRRLFLGNPELDWRYPTRFAGVFAPARAAATPSVQRFMRQMNQVDSTTASFSTISSEIGFPRRTHDMSIWRPHPDFDRRTMSVAEGTDVDNPSGTLFSLNVEQDPTPGTITLPTLTPNKAEVNTLRMPLVNTPLFERPQAELHMNLRDLDRDSFFRNQNTARLAGVTTHHSNVFQVRLTLGYFAVDPATGAVGAEYVNETGDVNRSKATFVIDRTIPVGYMRGREMDAQRTILYSEIDQ